MFNSVFHVKYRLLKTAEGLEKVAAAELGRDWQPARDRLRDTHFGIGSVNFAQGFADFAHGCVGTNRFYDVRHGVCI